MFTHSSAEQLLRVLLTEHLPPALKPRFVGSDLTEEKRTRIVELPNAVLRGRSPFPRSIGSHFERLEVAVRQREEDDRTHGRSTFEVDTTPDMLNLDMLNVYGCVHGSCIMLLINASSSIALVSLSIVTHKLLTLVSQSLATHFHSPAPAGARLRVVAETVAFSSRTAAATVEIWDITNKRLVATGVQSEIQSAKL